MELIASIQLGDIMFSSAIVLSKANKATKLFTKIKRIHGSVVIVPFYYSFIVSVEIRVGSSMQPSLLFLGSLVTVYKYGGRST